MAIFDAFRITAVLATYSYLQIRPCLSAASDSPFNEHAHASFVNCLKWVGGKNPGFPFVYVIREKAACVIPRKSHRRLCQIVGAERKELRDLGNLVGQ